MISRGYLCVNTMLCASIVYESLTFVSAGFLGDGIKTLHNIQPDEYRFKPKNLSSIASIGPANMWLTYIYTHKERIKKNIMHPARIKHNINLSKNRDKVINTIREMRNDTKTRIKKDKWYKEVDMDNENYEDAIIVGQDSVEQWQEKHDNITDLKHIRNSIERYGRKESLNNILSSISLNTKIYEDPNQEAHLNEWRGTYDNLKLKKTSEEEQLRIMAQNSRKKKLESEMKLLDIWSEDRGNVGKPEFKIRTVMRKADNYDDNDNEIDTNEPNIKVNNILIEDLQLWNNGHKAKPQDKITSINGTLFDPDYLDPAMDIGPIKMWQKNGKKRYENIMFSQSRPLGLWKVKEKKRENIDRVNDYSFHGINHFMNSLNLISMWSAREKKRKSLRDSRIMGIIDRWDNKQHDIGSIL